MNKPIGSGYTRPKELDDVNVDPKTKAEILERYSAAVSDTPSAQWDETDKRCIHEQIQAVLRRDNFRG